MALMSSAIVALAAAARVSKNNPPSPSGPVRPSGMPRLSVCSGAAPVTLKVAGEPFDSVVIVPDCNATEIPSSPRSPVRPGKNFIFDVILMLREASVADRNHAVEDLRSLARCDVMDAAAMHVAAAFGEGPVRDRKGDEGAVDRYAAVRRGGREHLRVVELYAVLDVVQVEVDRRDAIVSFHVRDGPFEGLVVRAVDVCFVGSGHWRSSNKKPASRAGLERRGRVG